MPKRSDEGTYVTPMIRIGNKSLFIETPADITDEGPRPRHFTSDYQNDYLWADFHETDTMKAMVAYLQELFGVEAIVSTVKYTVTHERKVTLEENDYDF